MKRLLKHNQLKHSQNYEEAVSNITQGLVGKLVQPCFKRFKGSQEGVALIVKVISPQYQHYRKTGHLPKWEFHILFDEYVEKFDYWTVSDFLDNWEIIPTVD